MGIVRDQPHEPRWDVTLVATAFNGQVRFHSSRSSTLNRYTFSFRGTVAPTEERPIPVPHSAIRIPRFLRKSLLSSFATFSALTALFLRPHRWLIQILQSQKVDLEEFV